MEVCCLIIADRAGTECFVSACCRWLMSVIAACMNTYSAKIFPEDNRITVSENYLEEAGVQDLCFVEKEPLATYFDKIDECIVFKWNRVYPADQHLDIDISKMTKVQEEEFVGFSHEKITMEVYER